MTGLSNTVDLIRPEQMRSSKFEVPKILGNGITFLRFYELNFPKLLSGLFKNLERRFCLNKNKWISVPTFSKFEGDLSLKDTLLFLRFSVVHSVSPNRYSTKNESGVGWVSLSDPCAKRTSLRVIKVQL